MSVFIVVPLKVNFMHKNKNKNTNTNVSVRSLVYIGFGTAIVALLIMTGIAFSTAAQSVGALVIASVVFVLFFLSLIAVKVARLMRAHVAAEKILQEERQPLLKAGALQDAIFNSANFSSIATDAKGVIQIFNVGADRKSVV